MTFPDSADNACLSSNEETAVDALDAGINVSRVREAGHLSEASPEPSKLWQENNKAGFAAWNVYVKNNGIPLAPYRKF